MINAKQLTISTAQAEVSETSSAIHKNAVNWDALQARILTILGQVALTFGSFAFLMLLWMVIASANSDLPGPTATLQELGKLLGKLFYDHGPNSKGIGNQVLLSLGRVFSGWAIGSLFAIPIGLLMGGNKVIMSLLNPIVQVLRPVSPLAWYPIGLAVSKNAGNAVVFAIIITSLWPTLINTMVGASSVPDDYRNVSRVFNFSRRKYMFKVLIPYSLPHILTGLRLSMGIAWMVIVAGEMLSGSTGIGFFVWDSWNALSLERVISAILIIGVIGLVLDRSLEWLTSRVRFSS
jgi:nitrate/nitrite transport system permease protein